MGSKREIIEFEGGDFLTAKCKTPNVKCKSLWWWPALGRCQMDLEWISDERVHGVWTGCEGSVQAVVMWWWKLICSDIQKLDANRARWPDIPNVGFVILV